MRFLSLLAWSLRLGSRSSTGILKHLVYALEACVVSRHAARTGFTHVHSHFGTNATTLAMFASTLGGLTYSFTIHGSEEWDSPRFLHIPEKVERAIFVSVISEFAWQPDLSLDVSHAVAKVNVIRCGVDSVFLRGNPTPVQDTPQFVMVGRIDAGKGCRILLDALSCFETGTEPAGWCWSATAPTGQRSNRVQRLAGCTKWSPCSAGKTTRSVPRVIEESRALGPPSFAEGLPVVIMEAFAMGRPVIATRVGGIAELVAHGVNGWLVDAGSVPSLAAALDAVSRDSSGFPQRDGEARTGMRSRET